MAATDLRVKSFRMGRVLFQCRGGPVARTAPTV